MTKDKILILIHDVTLDRTTSLENAKVSDVSYSYLLEKEIDFGYDIYNDVKQKYRNYKGEHVTPLDVTYPINISPRHQSKFLVTTLEELIKAFPYNLIKIDIKQDGEIGLEALDKIIELMDRLDKSYNTYNRILLASFNYEIAIKLKNLKETTHKKLMYAPSTKGAVYFYKLQKYGLDNLYYEKVTAFSIPLFDSGINLATPSLIKSAHKHNIAVHYWTINEEEEMKLLIKMKADGIITDHPRLLKQLIENSN